MHIPIYYMRRTGGALTGGGFNLSEAMAELNPVQTWPDSAFCCDIRTKAHHHTIHAFHWPLGGLYHFCTIGAFVYCLDPPKTVLGEFVPASATEKGNGLYWQRFLRVAR